MQSHAQGVVVELLYVNNSTVERLTDFLFKNLKIINLQISNAGLQDVAPNAFRGLEDTLQNLNLAGNQLRWVQRLSQVDSSHSTQNSFKMASSHSVTMCCQVILVV